VLDAQTGDGFDAGDRVLERVAVVGVAVQGGQFVTFIALTKLPRVI
jgi:hypothetical protein